MNSKYKLGKLLLNISKYLEKHALKYYHPIMDRPPLSKREHSVRKWFKENGDQTLRLDYPLNKESIVVDVGGYKGDWAAEIYCRYCSNIFVFEPVGQFFDQIQERFKNNDKVEIFPFGLSGDDKNVEVSIEGPASSAFKKTESLEKITLKKASKCFEGLGIAECVDLIKINIEGEEYSLLDNLIDSGMVKNINNIQVQFHDFVPDAKAKMQALNEKLSLTHELTYQYEFVWENWRKKSNK